QAREQLVQVENGPKLTRDFSECFKRARILALVLEEPRVLDRDGDMRAELPQDGLINVGELAWRLAEQIERTDHPPFAAKRHDELGFRSGNGFDVSRIGVNVVHDQWTAGLDSRADQPLAD